MFMVRSQRPSAPQLQRAVSAFALFAISAACSAMISPPSVAGAPQQSQPAATRSAASTTAAPGVPFSAEKLKPLLPETVYFEGRTAPLQTRNAGGTAFAGNAILWVSLVDSSGYASEIQNRYQFYLVTEGPLRVGDTDLQAGAYGGGFLGDRFLLMDLGGHTVAEGPTESAATLPRPRPLQLQANTPDSVKLYLGRRFLTMHAIPRSSAR